MNPKCIPPLVFLRSNPRPTNSVSGAHSNSTPHDAVYAPSPCGPALFADFLGTLPDKSLEAACAAIQAVSDSVGVSSPVGSIAVRVVLERRLRTDCPRSWSQQDRIAFAAAPPDIRAILVRRENERDAALRRKQNEASQGIGVRLELKKFLDRNREQTSRRLKNEQR